MTSADTVSARAGSGPAEDLEAFTARARTWLDSELPRRREWSDGWGAGSDAVPVFNNYDRVSGRLLMAAGAQWQQRKSDAGFAGITLSVADGGQGLTPEHDRAFFELEAQYETPQWDELLEVTIDLVAPTLAVHGSAELKAQYLRQLLAARLLACQLFSEPGAGSDLASLTCSAIRTATGSWVCNGQKVWNSGTQFADLGLLIARSEPAAPKHRGLTAFLVPMDTPGLLIRPIRQMTGGESFNEVFLTDAEIPDAFRLGEPGDGWTVALTTLRFEREHSAMTGGQGLTELFGKVLALAAHEGRINDPLVRQGLGALYARVRMVQLIAVRVQESMTAGQAPGPEGSMGKLLWSQSLTQIGDLVTLILGDAVVVDRHRWGTYTWAQHILGAPGFRIAGGSDEIQRTIVAERVLGLPREPRP
jgi:alkylation response protein AidB-like acyl-CoA dehydrogenase